MSLEARDCTLRQLLSLISARTGMRVTVSDAIPPVRLSLRTRAQSIEATVRELLRDTDVFVLYAAEPDAEQRLAAVWVYPRGSTRDIEPVPAELWASTRELQRHLTESDPDLRARAIEALIARAGEAALPQVLDALADADTDIRQRALDAALAANLDVPLHHLHALALNDLSPEVRLRALQALEERPDSAWVIESATHDSDSNVRREAQSILRRVTRTPR
jgi:HEAT repeat protein